VVFFAQLLGGVIVLPLPFAKFHPSFLPPKIFPLSTDHFVATQESIKRRHSWRETKYPPYRFYRR
jgi:hypothetical protein